MRLRTLTGWTILTALLAAVAYSLAFATASYFETGHLVDRIAADAAARGKAAADAQLPDTRRRFADDVRSGLLAASSRPGTVLTARGTAVSETPDGVRVAVEWTYPLLTVGGHPLVSVPLSVDRSISVRQ